MTNPIDLEELKRLLKQAHITGMFGDSAAVLEALRNAAPALIEELEAARKENTILRGLVQCNSEWKCTYGHQVDGKPLVSMSQCPSGFPGCGCADDLICGQEESFRALVEELEAARAELASLERILTVSVVLPPGTTIVAGCNIRTVVAGLSANYRSVPPERNPND